MTAWEIANYWVLRNLRRRTETIMWKYRVRSGDHIA